MKSIFETFGRRVAPLLIAQTRALPFMLSLMGLTIGVGFILGDSTSTKYIPLVELMPGLIWGYWFILYGIIKLIHSCFRLPAIVKLTNSFQGVWLWVYLSFVIAVFDGTILRPIDILLVLPIFGESFNILVDMLNIKEAPSRRKGDLDDSRNP